MIRYIFRLLCYPGAKHELAIANVVFKLPITPIRTNDSNTIWIAQCIRKRLRALNFLHYLNSIWNKNKQVVDFKLNDAIWSDRIARAHVGCHFSMCLSSFLSCTFVYRLCVCVCILILVMHAELGKLVEWIQNSK